MAERKANSDPNGHGEKNKHAKRPKNVSRDKETCKYAEYKPHRKPYQPSGDRPEQFAKNESFFSQITASLQKAAPNAIVAYIIAGMMTYRHQMQQGDGFYSPAERLASFIKQTGIITNPIQVDPAKPRQRLTDPLTIAYEIIRFTVRVLASREMQKLFGEAGVQYINDIWRVGDDERAINVLQEELPSSPSDGPSDEPNVINASPNPPQPEA